LDAFSAAKGKARFSGGAMTGFGRYAVKLTGPAEVSMSGVEVSGGRGAAGAFYDGKIVPGLGVVRVE
ncbi:MAG: hypothetical protein HY896_02740, partial [Deltaproteobacteria bacterium]|nr:hypothetical protein [Deltaproteobacteria bacterium]